jgi:C_GCAxxG_C_C family probable redox protein
MSDIDRAVELFRGGCACSQAILGTYGPRFDLDEDRAMRVAAGFGGGMRMAETCGAVTGAIMALGLARCGDHCRTADERQAAYGAVVAFEDDFRRRHGTLVCRELLGCDITTPEGAAAAREQGLFRSRCDQFVRDAAELLEERLRTP